MKSDTHRNHLISRPKNYQGTRRQALYIYPCWCGDSLTDRYRRMLPCCVNYLTSLRPWLSQIPDITERFHTVRRADGKEMGDFAFYAAHDDKEWDGAEADAEDAWEPVDYVLESWILIRRQVRTLGPEPLDEEEDDEPGRDR